MDKKYCNKSVGDVLLELAEIDKISQNAQGEEEVSNFTLAGGGFLSLICC